MWQKKWAWKTLTLRGIFGKTDEKTWCFDGQFVVFCVVDVVLSMLCFEARKM
jgi:hypothetical protein